MLAQRDASTHTNGLSVHRHNLCLATEQPRVAARRAAGCSLRLPADARPQLKAARPAGGLRLCTAAPAPRCLTEPGTAAPSLTASSGAFRACFCSEGAGGWGQRAPQARLGPCRPRGRAGSPSRRARDELGANKTPQKLHFDSRRLPPLTHWPRQLEGADEP